MAEQHLELASKLRYFYLVLSNFACFLRIVIDISAQGYMTKTSIYSDPFSGVPDQSLKWDKKQWKKKIIF